jgi:uncharacterized membrane protein
MGKYGNDLASFGRIYAIFQSFTATLVAIIFIFIGVIVYKSKATEKFPDPQLVGGILVIVGVSVLLISWGMVFFTQRSKTAAQAEGVFGGVNIFNDLTR